MSVLAIGNEKGGAGKTSVTLGLADIYRSQRNRRVLVIDADKQANSSKVLGVDVGDPRLLTLHDVLAHVDQHGVPGVAARAIVPAGETWAGVDVIPAKRALAEHEGEIGAEQVTRLRTALEGVVDHYDMVLIDCPPSLGGLTLSALVAADQCLVVTEPRRFSIDGVAEFLRTVRVVRERHNSRLQVAGIVINKHQVNRSDAVESVAELRELYGGHVLDAMIPHREVVAQAESAFASLEAYGSLAADVRVPLRRIAELIEN